jgi:uncharacterized protein YciI
MPYFALMYEVVDDYVERRAAFREDHLRVARAAHERGELLLGGAFSDPVDTALLIFRVPDASIVDEFARYDPYVTSGLVTSWKVRPWTVVVGNESDNDFAKSY